MNKLYNFDILIVGSGLSGLSLALKLAPFKYKIAILSKGSLRACNSYYAQGGIATVIDNNDSFEKHINDTLIAGAGLCDINAVEFIIKNAPDAINWLIDEGVKFTNFDNTNYLHLTKEGGHSERRILHVADHTGASIIDTLINKVNSIANIVKFENYVAIDLITSNKIGGQDNDCLGLYALNKVDNSIDTFSAKITVLATGGASKVYLYTSNPDIATGDGIAMAYRAGADIANMEFIQFHPTCLYHEQAKSFLISESLRGEGGILKLPNGKRFMQDFDNRLELAPRDIVARAIDFEIKRLGINNVFLDISHKPSKAIKNHFPSIYKTALKFGIDITKEPIPVVPAAHYTCGGISVNLNGATTVKNLFALGECSYTGFHGANRLASNSLLECLVISSNLAKFILNSRLPQANTTLPYWDETLVVDNDEEVVINHNWDELRRTMWDYVGIVRTNKRLLRALNRINLLATEINEFYANFRLSPNLIELRNLILVAKLITISALKRQESRGLHFSKDYPSINTTPTTTLLNKQHILKNDKI